MLIKTVCLSLCFILGMGSLSACTAQDVDKKPDVDAGPEETAGTVPGEDPAPAPAPILPLEPALTKALTLSQLEVRQPTESWSLVKTADCRFEIRSSKPLLKRLLPLTASCDELNLAYQTAAGYVPEDRDDTEEDTKSLGSCLRPILTTAFFHQFAQQLAKCQPVEPETGVPDPRVMQRTQAVYSACFRYADRMIVQSGLTRVDMSSLLTAADLEASTGMSTLHAGEGADLPGFAASFEKIGRVLASNEDRAFCSMGINDVINAQEPRNFLSEMEKQP